MDDTLLTMYYKCQPLTLLSYFTSDFTRTPDIFVFTVDLKFETLEIKLVI